MEYVMANVFGDGNKEKEVDLTEQYLEIIDYLHIISRELRLLDIKLDTLKLQNNNLK